MALKIGLISTYVPQRCGLATFASDLYKHLSRRSIGVSVAALSSSIPNLTYPSEVSHVISRDDQVSYLQAACHFEDNGTDVISLQHEYGIFGGPCGSYILHFLRRNTLPVITTLHTVLANPSSAHREVLAEIIRMSSRIVVFTRAAAMLLKDQWDLTDEQITVIPHGSPDVPYAEPTHQKAALGLPGRRVLLTIGLLSPNKGIETVIRALPAIAETFPEVAYVVQGITHPNVSKQCGESYRSDLLKLANHLGVASRVFFVNRYLDHGELVSVLADADIYISPHKGLDQAGSGTLAYALGLGRTIISTRYAYALEVLSGGSGDFFHAGDAKDLARQTIVLLGDRKLRLMRAQSAYSVARRMIWSQVAADYESLFEAIPSSSAGDHSASHEIVPPPLDLRHLHRLTDEIGILQHAIRNIPDRHHGYCTDDNARALMLAVDLENLTVHRQLELTRRYLAFLWHAFNQTSGRMRNFIGYDRIWLEDEGSEECHGRTLWALGHVVAHSHDSELKAVAEQLFIATVPASRFFTSLRATAFAIMGIVDFVATYPARGEFLSLATSMANELRDRFNANRSQEWQWFEDRVTYFNSRIPESLLRFGYATSRSDLIDVGLSALKWLIRNQTAGAGFFEPIGNKGFYDKGGERARFDQQPIEAHSTIDACLAALEVTGDNSWQETAKWVFQWFTGDNTLALPVYDSVDGGCRDGLGEDGLNYNKGAESTLAFMQALITIQPYCLQLETQGERTPDAVCQ